MHRYSLAEGGDLDQLVRALAQRAGFERVPVRRVRRTAYDTFDWRLFNAGSVLELEQDVDDAAGGALVWRSLESGEQLGHIEVDVAPRFTWELPTSPVAARLSEVVEMRALLALATVTVERTELRRVDAEGKTTARVVVERPVDHPAGGLAAGIELRPVRGYPGVAEEISTLLSAQVVLQPDDDDVLVAALRAAGHTPGAYTAKLRLRLEPEAPARAAWGEVLRALFGTMLANEAGLRDDVDSEFLHDYRVAVRRTRSVLGQGKRVLPAALLDRWRAEFAWLGQITSPPRDYDVFLLTLPEFQAQLPEGRRADLKPFGAFLEQHQREAYRALVSALDSPRYTALLRDWPRLLDDLTGLDAHDLEGGSAVEPMVGADAPDGERPAAAVAGERIFRAHRRLVRDGRTIDDRSHPEELHTLRKDAKKLRYLLECFGSLFPSALTTPVVKELKGLQDVLGEYQDCQVQVGALGHFGQQMLDEGHAPAATLLAMGSVVELLGERETRARAAFAARFERFDDQSVREAVRALRDRGAELERP